MIHLSYWVFKVLQNFDLILLWILVPGILSCFSCLSDFLLVWGCFHVFCYSTSLEQTFGLGFLQFIRGLIQVLPIPLHSLQVCYWAYNIFSYPWILPHISFLMPFSVGTLFYQYHVELNQSVIMVKYIQLEVLKHISKSLLVISSSNQIISDFLKSGATFNLRYPFILIKIFYLHTFYQKSIYWAFLIGL